MSMIERPLTQTADVAVKRASKKVRDPSLDLGIRRRPQPMRMMMIKLPMKRAVGLVRRLRIVMPRRESSLKAIIATIVIIA